MDGWLGSCRRVRARDDVAGVGARLIASYAEPARAYHGLDHLVDVLTQVDRLADVSLDPDVVRLAAWFHDAVYDPVRADNEARSATLAERELRTLRVDPAVVTEVARLVRLTVTHHPGPDDRNGSVLCDADLAVLGREEAGYLAYAQAIRAEYGHLDDEAFRAGRAAVLRQLLARPTLYGTTEGQRRWEETARRNLTRELAALRSYDD